MRHSRLTTLGLTALLAMGGCSSSSTEGATSTSPTSDGGSSSEPEVIETTTTTTLPPEALETLITFPRDLSSFPSGPISFVGTVDETSDVEVSQVLYVIRSGAGSDADPYLWWNESSAEFQLEYVQHAARVAPDKSWVVTWDSSELSGDYRFSARATSGDSLIEERPAGVFIEVSED